MAISLTFTNLISYINEGLLPTPYAESYNLEDYYALITEVKANLESGETVDEHEGQ